MKTKTWTHPMKGKKMTAAQKARLNMSGLALGNTPGPKHHAWKGDDAGYTAIHMWIYRQKGKASTCEDCGFIGRCHWANISGEYRRSVDDFKSLCPSCHLRFDGLTTVPRGGSIRVDGRVAP